MRKLNNSDQFFTELGIDNRVVFELDYLTDVTKLCSGIVNKYEWRCPLSVIVGTDQLMEFTHECAVITSKSSDNYLSEVLKLTKNVPVILVLDRSSDELVSNLNRFLSLCRKYDSQIIIVDATDNNNLMGFYHIVNLSYIKRYNDNYYLIVDESLLSIKYDNNYLFTDNAEIIKLVDDYDILVRRIKNTDPEDVVKLDGLVEMLENIRLNIVNRYV